jgi:hypothetical protein
MTVPLMVRTAAAGLAIALGVGAAFAHITPPVVLVSDRDAIVSLLAGARRFFVRELRLSPEDRQAVQQRSGWSPEDDLYRFYLGRDAEGRLVAASIFVTEFTVHGPVRVAVGVTPDGKIKGATVVEVTEETYPWIKPLIDQDLFREYVGRDSRGAFGLPERVTRTRLDQMPQFYAQVIAGLIQRAAVLYDVGVLRPGGAASGAGERSRSS